MGKPFESLTKAEILAINRRMIESYGGLFHVIGNNVRDSAPLDYVLEAMVMSFFGQEQFPTIHDKAAALCRNIIEGHVFHDGNKRTALEACRLLYEINGCTLPVDKTAEDMIVALAAGTVSFEEFTHWLAATVACGC